MSRQREPSHLIKKRLLESSYRSRPRSGDKGEHVYMDTNEAAVSLHNLASPSRSSNRAYPEGKSLQLKEDLSLIFNVPVSENISLAPVRGTTEGIEDLIRATCYEERDAIIICPPNFSVYDDTARRNGVAVSSAPLLKQQNFAVDTAAIKSCITPSTKLVFVTRPNNPTGTMTSLDTIRELSKSLTDDAYLIVDECYIEFSSEPSCIPLIEGHPNIVVLRTLSKAHSHANIRCGAVIGAPDIIQAVDNLVPNYAFTAGIINTVHNAAHNPRDAETMGLFIEEITEERQLLSDELQKLPIVKHIYPSEANFILCELGENTEDLCVYLEKEKIHIRDRTNEHGLRDHIRITVGSQRDNEALLKALSKYQKERGTALN